MITVKDLRERFGYLVEDSSDCQLEELLAMNGEQLLAEFDRIKAAEEKLNEANYLLEAIGWNRDASNNKRTRVYARSHYVCFRQTVMDEKRNLGGSRKYNAKPNTIIYLQDLANMIYCIYYEKCGFNSETGKINDKYSKRFAEFYEKEFKSSETK